MAVTSKHADCGISLLAGPTDIFPMVLSYFGNDPNAVDDDSLAAAEAQLKRVKLACRNPNYWKEGRVRYDL